MLRERDELPENIEELKSCVIEQDKEKESLQEEIERLTEIILLFRRRSFGSKSERDTSNQFGFFDEAELEAELSEKIDENAGEEDSETEVKGHKRKKGKRKPLPKDLPRETTTLELSQKEKTCSCGCELKEIGEEASEKLDVIPMQIKVLRTVRKKYACPNCKENVKKAEAPKDIMPKSNASPGLLAYIATSKYADGLPLYNQERIFSRHGIELPRSTTSNWMVTLGPLVQPLINLFWDVLLESGYLQMDETRVQVLKVPGKEPTSNSYMWVTARPGEKPIVIFEYDPTRKGDVPKRLLEGYEGYLQVDGYKGYNAVSKKAEINRVGCGFHIRRKFAEAFKATKNKNKGIAGKAISYFKKLFRIERQAKENNLSFEERYAFRQKEAKPIVDEMKEWLEEQEPKVPPKLTVGKAIHYALNEWSYFEKYLENGRLEIGTIFIENKIRPFAVGRRRWLFCNTVRGAESSAAIYSLIETAKANEHEPYWYLRYVFERLPAAKTVDDFEALLPWNVQKQPDSS
jgi:transposase